MKNYIVIIFISLFTCCTHSSNEKPIKDIKAEEIQRKNRNYDFNIIINTEDLQRDNNYNYKYLINVGYLSDEKNNLVFYKEKLLQHIIYQYQKNDKKGFDVYDRISVDTIKYLLSESELDSVYLLTGRLFQLDTLNFTNDSILDIIYDGYITEIQLNKPHDANYSITLTDISNKKLLENYKKLLSYIEDIKQ